RVQEQNEKPISVIIGNPPYNDSQANWNEFNPNRAYPEIDQRISDTYVATGTAQKTHQYDMYKRFVRWASDRLADDGIVGFITNRAYIDALQDDGFRKIMMEEFGDLYIVDLGGNFQRGKKAGNVFGIRIGVAIAFFVRDSNPSFRRKPEGVHYYAVFDELTSADKLAELTKLNVGEMEFEDIIPDAKGNWLDQSSGEFDNLLPLANRQVGNVGENSIFRLVCPGAKTDRDDWVYDFDLLNLRAKALFFADRYNELVSLSSNTYDPAIKWSSTLRDRFRRGETITYNEANRIVSYYRPFVTKHHFVDVLMNDRLTRNHYEMFGPDLKQENMVISFKGPSANYFAVLAANKLVNEKFAGTNNGGTFCLPLYRYTADGERVSNITEWGLRRINEHYRKEWGDHFDTAYPDGITAEDVFAYTYAVLHDPVYRHDYRVDLLREFPRLPLYHDFDTWAKMGQDMLDLHAGFEQAEPYPLERVDLKGEPRRVILQADREKDTIVLDDKTTLRGVPLEAWQYQLGSRSALEWVLDQYKERKPRDPTIAQRFNTYRFADYKERVIDLLGRVCAVSVKTVEIVRSMAYWEGGRLIVFGDRDKREWETMALEAFNSYYGESDDDPGYQAWLASLPDIREQRD
ncbi:MAG: Eco57I restriction-modification methylase domain-containing protein, partial [Chloroflexota bacterium]|nr:Eco57I restriction-modification methylase domain-containing protein [Chloroflexota bacterium]